MTIFRRQYLDSRLQFIGVCLLVSGVWILMSVKSASAQQISLSISPPVVEIMLAPNKKVSQTFNLEIEGDIPNLVPELRLAKPSDDTGHVEIDQKTLIPSDLPLTATISGPNTAPTVTLEAATTDIAKDVYLALIFRPTPLESGVYNLDSIPSISSLILVTINPSGVMPINLDFKDFEVASIHDSYYPLQIKPQIENHIPIMIRPKGKYEIVSPSGKTVKSIDLYPNLVLGNSTRLVRGIDKDQVTDLTWSPSWKDLGPYKLRLTLTTEGGTKITQTEKVVWILPIRWILVFFIILMLVILTPLLKKPKFKPV